MILERSGVERLQTGSVSVRCEGIVNGRAKELTFLWVYFGSGKDSV